MDITELEGGSKSWSPEEIGDTIEGKILNVKRVQQTSFSDNTPLFWDNGDPRMQTVVELQTDLRSDDDDDGVRSIWLKGGKNFEPGSGKGSSGEVALAQACRDAGSKSIDEGAVLKVAMTGLAKPTTRGYQPAKLYTMKYEAPVSSVDVDALWE